jgi:hypothetical protein
MKAPPSPLDESPPDEEELLLDELPPDEEELLDDPPVLPVSPPSPGGTGIPGGLPSSVPPPPPDPSPPRVLR